MAERMRALTLWQPMAWAVAAGHKPVENRGWPPPDWIIGERVAIHAGQRWNRGHALYVDKRAPLPPRDALVYGAVIATAVIDPAVTDPALLNLHERMWWMGPVGWPLRDVIRLHQPVPCRGYQKLWRLPEDVEAQVRAQLRAQGYAA